MSKIFSRIFHSEQAGLLLALLVLCMVISLLSPVFFTAINIKNVLRDASLIAIAGIGMVMIILLGEIDLSVGSTQAVAGVIAVAVLNQMDSVWWALLAALLAGALVGLCNGLLVTKAGINSLIATLGTMAILRGGAMVSTQAVSIQGKVEGFVEMGTGYLGRYQYRCYWPSCFLDYSITCCTIRFSAGIYMLSAAIFRRPGFRVWPSTARGFWFM